VRSPNSPTVPGGPETTLRDDSRVQWYPYALYGILVIVVLLIIVGAMLGSTPRRLPSHRADPVTAGESKRPAPLAPATPAVPTAPSASSETSTAKSQPESVREPLAPPDLSSAEIAERAESSVAVITGKSAIGTGFLVRPQLVVTSARSIAHEYIDQVIINFPAAEAADQGPFEASLIFEDPKSHLALLAVLANQTPLSLADSPSSRVGDEVTIIGRVARSAGAGRGFAVTSDSLGKNILVDGQSAFSVTAKLNDASSGGPVFDETGRVIGVAIQQTEPDEPPAFVIPVAALKTALRTAEALSPEEVARINARHRLAIVLQVASVYGRLFSTGFDACLKARADAGPDVGLAFNSINRASRLFFEKIKPFDKVNRQKFELEMFRLNANKDALIPRETITLLTELWVNLTDMRRWLDIPTRDLRPAFATTQEMRGKHKKLMNALKLKLDPELAAQLDIGRLDERLTPPDTGAAEANIDPAPKIDAAPGREAGLAASLTVELQGLDKRPMQSAGYVRLYGKVKNTSDRPIDKLVASIRVNDSSGHLHATIQVAVTPSVLPPGEVGSFFSRVTIFSPADRYSVGFTASNGQVGTSSASR
jgi:S1-C subfamily serine protease